MAKIGNQFVINTINMIVESKKEFLTIAENVLINSLINSNEEDLFNNEYGSHPKELHEVLVNAEMYYGFNENEVKRFLAKVEKLGYSFNYVDVATRDNGEMNHTVKPYALRKKD